MSFTFKAKVMGVEMEVKGSFSDHEDSDDFEILELRHKGESLDWDCLDDVVIGRICEEAFKHAGEEAMRFEGL